MDSASLRQMLRGPNMDTRQWVSMGVVDPDGDEARSVVFDEELGPLVTVTLQPTGMTVQCRVAGATAGEGEAEYNPFSAGDEVIVAIPEGNEASWPVILGRLNNAIDVWPRNVAGQDPTKNTFGFRRSRTPFVLETSAAYLVRNATTGAQFGLDEKGQFILNDASGTRLFLTPDAVGFSTTDGAVAMQIIPEDKSVFLQGGGASFEVNEKKSQFVSKGTISFATSGAPALGHAVTVEQLMVILGNLIVMLGPFLTPAAIVSWTIPPMTPGGAADVILSSIVPAALTPVPIGASAAVPGGLGLPLTKAALMVALAAPPDPTGLIAGVGKGGFLL